MYRRRACVRSSGRWEGGGRIGVAVAVVAAGRGAARAEEVEPDVGFIVESETFDEDNPYLRNRGYIGYPNWESRLAGENGTSPTVSVPRTESPAVMGRGWTNRCSPWTTRL